MAPAAVAILPQLLPAEAEAPDGMGGPNGLSGCQVADQALAMRAIWQYGLLFYFEGLKSRYLRYSKGRGSRHGREQPGSRTGRSGETG